MEVKKFEVGNTYSTNLRNKRRVVNIVALVNSVQFGPNTLIAEDLINNGFYAIGTLGEDLAGLEWVEINAESYQVFKEVFI